MELCLRFLLCVSVVVISCDEPASVSQTAPKIRKRNFEPPVGDLVSVPPFAITPKGVGPALLADAPTDVFAEIGARPHFEVFAVDGVVHKRVSRGFAGSLLFGGESTAEIDFVAVLEGSIGRAGEFRVGDALPADFKQSAPTLDRELKVVEMSQDAAIVAVVSSGDVAGILVGRRTDLPLHSCEVPCPKTDAELTLSGDEIELRSAQGVSRTRVPGLRGAALVPHSGGWVVLASSVSTTDDAMRGEVHVLTLAKGKLNRKQTVLAYRLDAETVRWIGSSFGTLDMRLVASVSDGQLTIGGVLWDGAEKLLLPMMPQSVRLRSDITSELAVDLLVPK